MPIELALLGESQATSALLRWVCKEFVPGGRFLPYTNGAMYQFLDSEGRGLLTVFPAKHVEDPGAAKRLVENPPEHFSTWTDVLIPWDSDRELAFAVADRIAEFSECRVHVRI